MKRIKKILFANCEPGVIEELAGQLKQRVIQDPVLKCAEVEIRQSFIEGSDHGLYINDPSVQANVEWADLILASGLLEEDKLCVSFFEARSITLTLPSLIRPGERWQNDCASIDQLLPIIIGRIKDSFSNAILAKGTALGKGTVVGTALVAKKMADLLDFQDGQILVMDRPGMVIFRECDDETLGALTKKYNSPGGTTLSIEEQLQQFAGKLGVPATSTQLNLPSNHKEPEPDRLPPTVFPISVQGAFEAALGKSIAAVFSRGRHGGEVTARVRGIPCISCCVGATDVIKSGQRLVVDADRGEIFNQASL